MTRKNKLVILIAYLLFLVVFMLAYRSNRAKKVKQLKADLGRISADKEKVRATEAEVSRLMLRIPTESNVPGFIEELYRIAKESGVTQHEVATEADKGAGSGRPGGSATSAIAKNRVKISAIGGYRNFAEYVRQVQNIERFNRIIDFKLVPDATQLKGTLTIELYSLPVKL